MNELIVTTKLTKKVILQQLMKIKIDHSIQISEAELDAKVNLLFEDCKDCSAELFIAISEKIRKQEMFGKLPANYLFSQKVTLIEELNMLAGQDLFEKVEKSYEEIILRCKGFSEEKIAHDLPELVKNSIRYKLCGNSDKIIKVKF